MWTYVQKEIIAMNERESNKSCRLQFKIRLCLDNFNFLCITKGSVPLKECIHITFLNYGKKMEIKMRMSPLFIQSGREKEKEKWKKK